MGYPIAQSVWELARRQHDVVARWQLLALGYSGKAIKHRIAKGRLHPIFPGVYAVGTPNVTQRGLWMAAVLACGPEAVLSHESAAALWGIRPSSGSRIHVSVPSSVDRRPGGIRVHRRSELRPEDIGVCDGIPVTSPTCTLIDLAARLSGAQLERAVNEADKLDLVHPEQVRTAVERTRRPGARALRELLDRLTFVLTDSELELLFVPIAHKAGLPKPKTQSRVNGFKVDFYWPDLKLVVETDGGRFHRTPSQQKRDRVRDQRHTAAGLTPLRFTHDQVKNEPRYVEQILKKVRQLPAAAPAPGAPRPQRSPRGREECA